MESTVLKVKNNLNPFLKDLPLGESLVIFDCLHNILCVPVWICGMCTFEYVWHMCKCVQMEVTGCCKMSFWITLRLAYISHLTPVITDSDGLAR